MPLDRTKALGAVRQPTSAAPEIEPALTPPTRSSIESLSVFVVLLSVVTFYFWTVSTNGNEPHGPSNYYYPLLARAFVDGHLYLEIEPPPQLLALPDPYDPEQNKPYRLHDASLYHGKYYIYFGASPAVLLFAPFYFLTLRDFPQPVAVALFCSLGYLFSARLFLLIVRDYYSKLSLGLILACLLTLGMADGCPFLLRRPDVYEAAIACAYCFMQLAFFYFYLALRDPQRLLSWLLVVSFCLGVAAGSRLNFVLAVPVFMCFLVWLWRQGVAKNQSRPWTPLLALLPVSLLGVLVALYNYARFDSPFEFGTNYVLAAVNMHTAHAIDAGNIPYNIWFYLFCPPHLSWQFPFIHADPLSWCKMPKRFLGLEPIVGLFIISPISLLSLALPILIGKADQAIRISLLFMALAITGPLLIVLCFCSATMRYLCDFAPTCIFLGCLMACHFSTSFAGKTKTSRWITQVVLMTMLFLGCWNGLLLSFTGYYDYLEVNAPQTYATLGWLFHPVEIIAKAITELF